VLKARKLTFCNPTARIRGPRLDKAAPPPIELAVLRAALNSVDPATAAIAALIAFHALTSGQICSLHLSDVHDGRLHLHERVIPLARPVRKRLRAYLDYRNDRWPTTAKPHLFIHYRTATHTGATTAYWVRRRLGLNPQHVRQDRILDEAHATRRDIRLVCDLFGLTAAGAYRYTATVDRSGIADYVHSERED
jgi:integrase